MRMRLLGTMVAVFTLCGSASAQDEPRQAEMRGAHGESCRARVDCEGGLVCVQNVCLKPGEEPPAPGAQGDLYDNQVPWRSNRLGIYYLITPPIAGDLRTLEAGHSVGIESSSRLFAELRYRATFGYAALPGAGTVVHGMRADLLTLGYTITAAKSSSVRFGIEPMVNFINLETYFPPIGSQFAFSSGWSVGAILGFGSGHGTLTIEPIGMDFRWLTAGSGVPTLTGVGVQWRGRVSIGVAF